MAKSSRLTTAKVESRGGEWFITGLPCGECGPYSDKDTARDDALGMERFYKHYDEPGFITCDDSRLNDKN